MKLKMEIPLSNSLTLWQHPLLTVKYFVLEVVYLINQYCHKLMYHKEKVLGSVAPVVLLLMILLMDSASLPHVVASFQKTLLLCIYWISLGILSSVGLGTGLHTFLLYLGPHIARVTLAAYECQSLDFPSPPYPDRIICPGDSLTSTQTALMTSHRSGSSISVLRIMSKVQLEAFMWGVGTAIGELPPYFMARFARLSRSSGDLESGNEDLDALTHILRLKEEDPSVTLTWSQKLQLAVHSLVHKVGFWGILVCASVPNPLFDLAGLTCGHFFVPFWTFFGATLLGKAVFKMHLQSIFVIVIFSKHHFHSFIMWASRIPLIGHHIEIPLREFLKKQHQQLHWQPGSLVSRMDTSWLQWLFEWTVFLMVLYFALSIVNSLAQNYQRRRIQLDKLIC